MIQHECHWMLQGGVLQSLAVVYESCSHMRRRCVSHVMHASFLFFGGGTVLADLK